MFLDSFVVSLRLHLTRYSLIALLAGREFQPQFEYNIADQVRVLIEQATLHENLCQCYIGWCPFW
jgi:phosphatidylinositol kinase/protein kinase (PI-3  family)